MYALIEFKGKQYKAEKGKRLRVDKIDAGLESTLNIETVLMVSGDKVSVGTPYVKGAKVTARVEAHEKDRKVTVFKYIPKKDHRRKRGHRQQYSIITIEDIAV